MILGRAENHIGDRFELVVVVALLCVWRLNLVSIFFFRNSTAWFVSDLTS